jgi:cell division protein FtsN
METPEVKAARETAPGPEAPVVAADALEAESGSADPGPDDPDRTRLALASPPAVAPPAETATSEAAQAASPALDDVPVPGDTGRWIINLASYAGPRTADRMQRKFENLGVSTDRQVAEVNGKTMYRLRIAAFRSYGDAEAYFNSIKDRLGLESAWITKQ